MRAASTKAKTRADAERPWEFQEIRQPSKRYLAIPLLSSERRHFMPCTYFAADVITNNLVSVIEEPSLSTFGILASHIFWVWAGAVSGRLESRVRVSNEITYNNFPFPELTDDQTRAIEHAAAGVLEARSFFLESTLADLYDPETMPTQLRDAHEVLERQVEKALSIPKGASEEVILDRLFDRYNSLLSEGGLFPAPAAPSRRRRAV